VKVLIANRGEIAIRIARAAAGIGVPATAIYSEDDARSLHTLAADEAVALSGVGPAAYLNGGQIIEAAIATGCDLVHPGYGFLSEDAAFAQDCADNGLGFVGPSPAVLAQVGDKVRARALAESLGITVLDGSAEVESVADDQGDRRRRRPRHAGGRATGRHRECIRPMQVGGGIRIRPG